VSDRTTVLQSPLLTLTPCRTRQGEPSSAAQRQSPPLSCHWLTLFYSQLDPGVESWNYMVRSALSAVLCYSKLTPICCSSQRENVWKHFRFTNRTARLSLLWGVLVPIGVYSICQKQDVRRPTAPSRTASTTPHLLTLSRFSRCTSCSIPA
jgi:hypothetical protein